MAKRNKKSRKTRRNNAVATQPVVAQDHAPVQDEAVEMSSTLPGMPVRVAAIVDVTAEPDRDRVTVPEVAAVAAPAPVPEPLPAEPMAAPPIEERAPLEDVDEAFFRAGDEIEAAPPRAPEDSIPPVSDDIAKQVSLPPPPEVLARRSKFRKFVGAVVALGALVVVGGLGKTLTADGSLALASSGNGSAAIAKVEVPKPAPVKVVEQPAAQPEPVAAMPAHDEPAPAEAEPVEEPKAAEPAPALPDGVDPRKEALNLLNRGKMAEAVPMARAAIAQDPTHALGYLYLGTALQESGSHKDAIAAYSDCVRNAKKGPVWECRAMGGRE